MQNNFFVLCRQLGELCVKNNVRIALAESCTGGMLSAFITDVPGSSAWFMGSAVVYHNTAKKNVLHISEEALQQHGAVSEASAIKMAEGAIQQFDADLTVAITGVAGPQGGITGKPVGTVCFALVDRRSHFAASTTKHFESGRDWVRRSAAEFALEWMIKYLGSR